MLVIVRITLCRSRCPFAAQVAVHRLYVCQCRRNFKDLVNINFNKITVIIFPSIVTMTSTHIYIHGRCLFEAHVATAMLYVNVDVTFKTV